MLACCTCDDGVGDCGLEQEEEFDTATGEGAHARRLRETNSEQGTLRSRATFSSSDGRKSPSALSAQSSPRMSLQRRSRPPPLLIPDSSPSAHMMGSPSPGAAGPGMGREDSHLGVILARNTSSNYIFGIFFSFSSLKKI